jgi:hypothetical protein
MSSLQRDMKNANGKGLAAQYVAVIGGGAAVAVNWFF